MQGHPMNSPKKHLTTTDSPIYQAFGNYIRNPIFDNPSTNNNDMADAMDETSYQQNNHLQSPTNVNLQYLLPPREPEKEHFLTGPVEFVGMLNLKFCHKKLLLILKFYLFSSSRWNPC